MSKNNIKNWTAPSWHTDFGDPNLELSLLKESCLFLLEINEKFNFELDCYEEGYLRILIYHNKDKWGESVVSDMESKRIGIFKTNGRELYFSLS